MYGNHISNMSDEMERIIRLERDSDLTRVALLFSMMKQVRSRLLKKVEDITDEELDFTPDEKNIETIGTLLLHIAAVEWSWIFEDIDGEEMDYEKWKHAFALRESIPQLKGKGKQFYIDRLAEVRGSVYERLKEMGSSELDKLIAAGGAKVSIEWILFHIIEHEAMHIGQISVLLKLFRNQG